MVATIDSDAVRLDYDDGVATITLNQPDRRNAFSAAIQSGIAEALDRIESDGDARVVVFEGAGEAFSAGGDISKMRNWLEDEETTQTERAREIESGMELMATVDEFPLYTVAKVDGPAVGAGAALTLACDIQLASERSVIGFVFRNVGLAVDNGVSHLLPQVVGRNVAKELTATGELVDAERAADLGLVNHVYPTAEFEERADDLIAEIASGPTVALRHTKRLVDEGADASLREALADEALSQTVVMETRDHREGVEAFFEKRDPEFEGR
ncbi:MAG: enoyl-CoA hydratase/isomerase family protein [Haloarculaceae archaeon]